MKYQFSITVNGEITDSGVDGAESIQDIHQVVLESFPHNIQAGVSVRAVNMMVHQDHSAAIAPQGQITQAPPRR